MITFLSGLAILILGGAAYGRICEKIIAPTDARTPAFEKYDGVDYVPMRKWKNCLIELLNIAGTGPILGPIQGILFGPIAFITIPIGCVLGGAFHDYMCGMISMRNGGDQMPGLVRRFLGRYTVAAFNVVVSLSLLLVGAVFIYTPGDLIMGRISGQGGRFGDPLTWIVYGCIFAYYVVATLLPIDKIIGRIYPVFGGILLVSALGIFIGLFARGYRVDELWTAGFSFKNSFGDNFIPIFFVTVACGIVSGFHSTQSAMIARTVEDEHEGRVIFYNMMIVEGFIAMVWAAAAMGVVNGGIATPDMLRNAPVGVVSRVAENMLGRAGGTIAIIGVIVLPITSGDTALRSLRLMISDAIHIKAGRRRKDLLIAIPIFALVAGILVFAKADAGGFNIMWRYFAWANECIAVFAFAMICVYMMRKKMPYLIAMIPGMFYMFIVSTYILGAKIGFRLPAAPAYIAGGVLTALYAAALVRRGKMK